MATGVSLPGGDPNGLAILNPSTRVDIARELMSNALPAIVCSG